MDINGEQGSPQRSDGRADAKVLGQGSTGEPVVLLVGEGTSDATIVTEIGADANYADGSLYLSAVNGAGQLFQKRNDVWVEIEPAD